MAADLLNTIERPQDYPFSIEISQEFEEYTPVERPDYRVGVPKRGRYTLLLDSHGAYKAAKVKAALVPPGNCY